MTKFNMKDHSSTRGQDERPLDQFQLLKRQTHLASNVWVLLLRIVSLLLQIGGLLLQMLGLLFQQVELFVPHLRNFIVQNAKGVTTALVAIVILNILLSYVDTLSPGLLVSYSDELSYFKNLQSFSENGYAGVPIAYDLTYSEIGAYSSHGPFYTYFYGFIPSLFGPIPPQWMLFQNTVMCLAALALGWYSVKLSLTGKNLVVLIMSTNLVFVVYIHMYMVEAAHIFAVALLAAAILATDTAKRRPVMICVIIIAAFMLSLTRISWIALYGLALVQCRSRISVLLTVLASGAALMVNFWIYSNFFASYEEGFLHQLFITLDQDGIILALKVLTARFFTNIGFYLSYWDVAYGDLFGISYLVFKALYIVVFVLSAYLAYTKKDRILVGMVVVNVLTLFALLFLYDAYSWREHRSLNTIYILNIILMARHLKLQVLTGIVVIQLLCLPGVWQFQRASDQEYRREFREFRNASGPLMTDIARLKELPPVKDQDLVTIGAGTDIIPQRKSVFLLEMPVRSDAGARIRYSMAVNKPLVADGHDYLLQRQECMPGTTLYEALPSFNICKVAQDG